jgi:hypothetical protein
VLVAVRQELAAHLVNIDRRLAGRVEEVQRVQLDCLPKERRRKFRTRRLHQSQCPLHNRIDALPLLGRKLRVGAM